MNKFVKQASMLLIIVRLLVQVVHVLETVVHDTARQHYRAFFNSVLGGITTNPALMAVHIDDHMVHRSVHRQVHFAIWNATVSIPPRGFNKTALRMMINPYCPYHQTPRAVVNNKESR